MIISHRILRDDQDVHKDKRIEALQSQQQDRVSFLQSILLASIVDSSRDMHDKAESILNKENHR
jgi:hypothetical protein